MSQSAFRRNLWLGVLAWMLIGALGVAARGVQWEEGYERAQAMLQMVQYPPGHPLYVYGWKAPTIQYYSSAALLWLTQSPLIVCGLRNLLAVWMLVVPMFLLGASFTRSIIAGHIAALLLLVNAHHIFQSYYDNNVWPGMFTSGSIGLGWALMCVCAFAYGRWRLAFFLATMMPVVHGGQWPPVLGLALCMLVVARTHWRQALQGAAAGGLVVAACIGLHLLLKHPVPDYGNTGDSAAILDTWQRFTYFEDIHRRPQAPPRFGPFAHTTIGLMLALLLSAWALTLARYRRVNATPATVAMLYCALCAGAVWGAWLVQQAMGVHTPYLIIGWLPYRLGNHAVLVIMALGAACAYSLRPRHWRFPLVAFIALLWLASAHPLALLLPESLHQRYIAPPTGPLFLLLGGAFVNVWGHFEKWPRIVYGLIAFSLVTLAATLYYLQFAAACLLLGFVLSMVLGKGPRRSILLAPITLAIAVTLAMQIRDHRHLPVSPFEQQLRHHLAQDPDQSRLVVTPLYTINYQEKLQRGIFATFETQLLIPYMPALGPRVEGMLTDMYGFRFGRPWTWELDALESRTPAQWQALAAKYHLGYVLCPERWPLQLPEVMRGEGLVLYRVE